MLTRSQEHSIVALELLCAQLQQERDLYLAQKQAVGKRFAAERSRRQKLEAAIRDLLKNKPVVTLYELAAHFPDLSQDTK